MLNKRLCQLKKITGWIVNIQDIFTELGGNMFTILREQLIHMRKSFFLEFLA